MTTDLRPYQARAMQRLRASYARGHRRIVLVSPTGSGKTRMGVELAASHLARVDGARVLWVAHQTELLRQARGRLLHEGVERVGIIAAAIDNPDPDAPVQVCSIQTLHARDLRPDGVTMIIADEAHHYAADQWGSVLEDYPDVVLLGLTATPERGDGRPLGDVFDDLVVGAQPRELVELGHLVDVDIVHPDDAMASDTLAEEPLVAYLDHGEAGQAFAFARSVAEAERYAAEFGEAGHPSACIHGGTAQVDRDDILERFRGGDLRVLWNVYVLTEGVDVPAASVCILARGCGSTGTYLQMAGRVLRPHPDKDRAIIIDLAGASLKHGSPLDDRSYSLEGRRGIGAVPEWFQAGNDGGTGRRAPMQVAGVPLRGRGRHDGPRQRWDYYAMMTTMARQRGYKPGWASHRYRARYGEWPPGSWRQIGAGQ